MRELFVKASLQEIGNFLNTIDSLFQLIFGLQNIQTLKKTEKKRSPESLETVMGASMYQGLMNRVQILKAKNCNVPEIGGLGFPFAKICGSHGDADN